MSDNNKLHLTILIVLGFLGGIVFFYASQAEQLDPRHEQDDQPAIAPTTVLSPPHDVDGVVPGVQPSTEEESSEAVEFVVVDGDPGDCAHIAEFADLTDSFLPTAGGLYARTGDLWNQVEFLTARYDSRDLPTLDDCVESLSTCHEVQRLLNIVALDETIAYAVFADKRATKPIRKALQDQLDIDYAALFAALDECGPYRRWRELGTEFMEWDQ